METGKQDPAPGLSLWLWVVGVLVFAFILLGYIGV